LRNGIRTKTITTAAGDVDLGITKLRQGAFFPSLLERRRRIDQALFAVVMEAYVTGTSVRKVDDLVKALGADTGISKSEVSRICAELDGEVAAFADRDLTEQAFPYVFLDATYCKARIGGGKGGRGSLGGLLAGLTKSVNRPESSGGCGLGHVPPRGVTRAGRGRLRGGAGQIMTR
jgi:transposase-like protein